ncbi:MAG: hypothetical protein WDO17_15610 [Alphaproteobacteria bacterium]
MAPAKRSAAIAPIGEQAFVLFDELLRSRDRLAGLSPLTARDLETISQAMHEVIWFFLTPPKGRKTDLALSEEVKAGLLRASGDRTNDLYTLIVAAIALKLAGGRTAPNAPAILDRLGELLDSLAFDSRAAKKTALGLLRRAREEVDARIAYVRQGRPQSYRFSRAPEQYRNRRDKTEKPDAFFRRVYGADVRRGLTQADLRRADPAFYNVLHVWCTRREKRLSAMLPASRPRGH